MLAYLTSALAAKKVGGAIQGYHLAHFVSWLLTVYVTAACLQDLARDAENLHVCIFVYLRMKFKCSGRCLHSLSPSQMLVIQVGVAPVMG